MVKKLLVICATLLCVSAYVSAQDKTIELRHGDGQTVQVLVDEAGSEDTKSYQLEISVCYKAGLVLSKDGDKFDFRTDKISTEQKAIRWLISGNDIEDINEMRKIFGKEKAFIQFSEGLKKKQRKVIHIIKSYYKSDPEKASKIEANIEKVIASCEDGRFNPFPSNVNNRPASEPETKAADKKITSGSGFFSMYNSLPKDEVTIHEQLFEQNGLYKELITDMKNGLVPDVISRKYNEHFAYYVSNSLNTSDIYKFRIKGTVLLGRKGSSNPRAYFFYDKDKGAWILTHTQYKHYVGGEKPKERNMLHNILSARVKNYLAAGTNDVVTPEVDVVKAEVPNTETGIQTIVSKSVMTQQEKWDYKYELLKKYIEDNQEIATRYDTVLGDNNEVIPIGDWVKTQISSYNDGTLLKERADKLEKLSEWTWTPYETSWNNNYEILKLYVTGYGAPPSKRTNVTLDNDKTVKIGEWTYAQKSYHAKGTLSEARTKKLEALSNWTWSESTIEPIYDNTRYYKQLGEFIALAEKLNIQISDRVASNIKNLVSLTPEAWMQFYNLMVNEYENNKHSALCETVISIMSSEAEIPGEVWELTIAVLSSEKLDADKKKELVGSIFSSSNKKLPTELVTSIDNSLLNKELITSWEGTIKDLSAFPYISDMLNGATRPNSNFIKTKTLLSSATITEQEATTLLSEYLPEAMRSKDIDVEIRNLILYIVNDKDCAMGEKERTLLFDNGLFEYLASTGNKNVVFILGSLISSSESCNYTDAMYTVSMHWTAMDISSLAVITDGKMDMSQIELDLGIKLSPTAIEKIYKGVDGIVIKK